MNKNYHPSTFKGKIRILCLVGLLGITTMGNLTPLIINARAQTPKVGQIDSSVLSLDRIKFIGFGNLSSLGFGEIEDLGNGNFSTTRYVDDNNIYLQPIYQLKGANISKQKALQVRVTIQNTSKTFVSIIDLKQNSYNSYLYDQKTSTNLSKPGSKRTKVYYELLTNNKILGTFTINFAPATEQPQNYQPIVAPEGKYDAPQNVRIENSFLKWDPVNNAEQYRLYAYRCDNNGNILSLKGDAASDSLATPQESLKEIKSFLELPAGQYRFALKASSLYNGFWNGTLASNFSEKTALVMID